MSEVTWLGPLLDCVVYNGETGFPIEVRISFFYFNSIARCVCVCVCASVRVYVSLREKQRGEVGEGEGMTALR